MDIGTAGVPYLRPINGGLMSATYQPASEPARMFRFGEFTFDCGSRQLLRRGVERHLSPKAQHLLQLLILVRPQALSREELYDALWPLTFVCETNLATIINELRRALGDDARASQFIRTVHGFGYSFCGEVASQGEIPFTDAILLCDERSHQLFEGPNAVGRTPDCRIVINDPTVSRRHALIVIDGRGGISIKDLDSKNGTHVDGQRIGPLPGDGHAPRADRLRCRCCVDRVSQDFVHRLTTTGRGRSQASRRALDQSLMRMRLNVARRKSRG